MIPFDEYQRIQRMNPSTLVHGLHSMKRLKRAIDGDVKPTTKAMQLGTCAHVLLLEPDEFAKRFVVMPDFHLDEANVDAKGNRSESKMTNYVKRRRAEFDAGGRETVTEFEYRTAWRMICAIQDHHSAPGYLSGGVAEYTVQGEIGGELCKGRLDYCKPDCIVDVKTTNSLARFGKTFANMSYGFKMAFYQELVRQEVGRKLPVYIVAQEDRDDFDTAVFDVPQAVLDNGLANVRRVMLQYQICRIKDDWPGYDRGEPTMQIDVPLWSMNEEDCLDWSET